MEAHEILEDKQKYYIVTEILEGGQLKSHEQNKLVLDEDKICNIAI